MASQNASLLLDLFVFSRHAVDHDVGQAVATPPPASEAEAEELETLEPVDRLPDVLTLQHGSWHQDDHKKCLR